MVSEGLNCLPCPRQRGESPVVTEFPPPPRRVSLHWPAPELICHSLPTCQPRGIFLLPSIPVSLTSFCSTAFLALSANLETTRCSPSSGLISERRNEIHPVKYFLKHSFILKCFQRNWCLMSVLNFFFFSTLTIIEI